MSAIDLGSAARDGFAAWRGFDDNLRFYGTAAFGVAVLLFAYAREHKWSLFADRLRDKRTPRVGRPPIWERPFRRIVEPLDIGGVVVDFFEQHLDILAMSGGFKTTLMAMLVRQRLKDGRRVVVVTGGQSPALEEEIAGWGGWVIKPHTAPMTFDAWEGDKLFVAQGWAELLPTSSEIKVIQSCFQLAVLDYLESRTDYRVGCTKGCGACTNTFGATHDGLANYILTWEPDAAAGITRQRVSGMKESYGLRLKLLDRVFGDWIGQELSIVQAIRQGIPLMFVLDASTDPDFNRFSTVLVWWSVLHAVQEEGDFDVFVDELARLGLSEKLLVEQIRTFRVNGVHFVGGTHASEDLKGNMGDLIQLHAYGRMSSTAIKTRVHAQASTYNVVPAGNFGRHNLKRGEFVVIDHEDRISLARIPTYRRLPSPRTPRHARILPTYRQSGMNYGTGDGFAVHRKTAAVPRTVAVPELVGTAVPEVLEGPTERPRWCSGPNVERKLQIWQHFKSTPIIGCWKSNYALKGNGKRPGCEYRGKNWNVSALVLALDDCAAMGLKEDGEIAYLAQIKLRLGETDQAALSVQHECHDRECVRADHLDWLNRGDNIDEYWEHWRVQRAATA